MRRTLGPLLLTTVLAAGALVGCGTDTSTDARDAAPTGATAATPTGTPATGTATPAPSQLQSPGGLGIVEATTIDILSATSASGEVDDRATVLDGPSSIDSFARQFRSPAMSHKLSAAVDGADLPAGQTLLAAVVSIGCDVPSAVTVLRREDGLAITAMEIASPQQECFAPVTAVALVAVDSAEV